MVAVQLKILIPVGMPTSMLETAKNVFDHAVIPTANMWCAQTPKLMNPIATTAATMAGLPKRGLREKTGKTSDKMANAGKIRIYTSGWPKIQKKCCQRTADPPAWVLKKLPPM